MSDVHIQRCDGDQGERTASELEQELLATLARTARQSTNTKLVFSARNTKGALIGGVTGSTSYGWLLVKVLWVDDAYQGAGLGRSLMKRIEGGAVELGCHGARLDTSNVQARGFYLSLGYRDLGLLENMEGQHPAGHKRWFMKRSLPAQ